MAHNKALRFTLRGAAEMAVTLPLAPILRSEYNRWGATDAELRRALPGDAFIPQPKLGYTRAISIDVPPGAVWPWIDQLGWGRGGLYSYDGLENLVGCDLHSADKLLSGLLPYQVGDHLRMGKEGYPAMYVLDVQPGHYLLAGDSDEITCCEDVQHVDLAQGPPDDSVTRSTWLFHLDPEYPNGTRLIVRQRLTFPDVVPHHLMWGVVEPMNFVMERATLQGIKARAEGKLRQN